jgi:hypothetical protein
MTKEIIISEHIIERYIERINPQLQSITDYNKRLIAAKQAINVILKDAKYVSDDNNGVLLISKTFNCAIIVRERVLITMFSPNKIKKEKKSNGNFN